MPEQYYVGEVIGVTDLYIAQVALDNQDNYTVGAPELFAPTASVAEDTAVNQKFGYYSNKALYTYTSEGVSKMTLVIPNVSTKAEAMLLGKPYDETSGLMYDSGSLNTKYFALGYKSQYALEEGGEGERFVWWLKGSFSIPKRESATKTDQVDNKALTVEYSAISSIHKFQLDNETTDGAKRVQGDTSDDAFDPKTWFTEVITPPEIAVPTP